MLAGIINYVDRQIIAVLKPMLQAALGWSDSDYGFIVGVTQFASALAFIGAGWLVDRLGWRRANPWAVGAWSLASVGHVFAQTIAQFAAVRLVLGASEALSTPAVVKTVGAVFSAEQRSLVMGATNMATSLGAILTPLLVPLLALRFGWRAAFLGTALLGFLWVLLFLWRMPHRPSPSPPSAVGGRTAWRALLSDRATWAFVGAKALFDHVWWFLLFWIPDLLQRQFGLSMRDFGPTIATIYALSAAGSLLGGWMSGRLLAGGMSLNRARKGTMLVAALLALPVPLVLVVGNVWGAVFLLGLVLAGHQAFSVNVFALAADTVPNDRLATVISLGALAGNMAGMVVLQSAGWLLQSGRGYAPLLALVSVSFLIALGWIQVWLPNLGPRSDGR